MTKLDLEAALLAYDAAKDNGLRPVLPLMQDALETIPGLVAAVRDGERESDELRAQIRKLYAEIEILSASKARLERSMTV